MVMRKLDMEERIVSPFEKLKQQLLYGGMGVDGEAFRKFLEQFEGARGGILQKAMRRADGRTELMPINPMWGNPDGEEEYPDRTDYEFKEIEEEIKMSAEEYFLVVAERLLGCYTDVAYVKSSKHVICACNQWEETPRKIEMGTITDDGKELRGHCGICTCGTLFVKFWDGKDDGTTTVSTNKFRR